jgi:AraC-like DNA-binding protein
MEHRQGHLHFSEVDIGCLRHGRRERLDRHCHRAPFAAIVLRGGYVEAGDRGRQRVGPGDVILHEPYESHLDEIYPAGAEVLVLPWWRADVPSPLGKVADPDILVRIAEHDAAEAVRVLVQQMVAVTLEAGDWPDRLALDLRRDPSLSLEHWADMEGLRPETVSRGFRRIYGIAPMAFRARMRVLRAFGMIRAGHSLVEVAARWRFADQAHLTRSFRALTGMPPGRWRTLADGLA